MLKGKNLLRSKFFPFRIDPFSEESKSNFDKDVSLKSVLGPLKSHKSSCSVIVMKTKSKITVIILVLCLCLLLIYLLSLAIIYVLIFHC